ncbi:MAG: hypothetical protein A2Y33_07330 [Spirochaetes bacterium GWF1_51_8]|nr:MAG: hypothetical protein A2Y33_07330 [Spirochaetes bacterium GWF1_51_8]
MKVLLVASEAVPFAKVGGLADVVGAQGKIMQEEGLDVRIAIPKYKVVSDNIEKLGLKVKPSFDFTISLENREEKGRVEEVVYAGVTYYLIDRPDYFMREGIYTDPQSRQDYPDNLRRFVFFSRAILECAKGVGFQPDIIHVHDWQTGLIPVYLRTDYKMDSFFRQTKCVFTIHNLAYQGIFPVELFTLTGLDWKYFTIHGLEYYGHLNLMKGGIVYSDVTTTVSQTYAKEIQTPEYGNGLEGVMSDKALYGNLYGIFNGVDYSEWHPSTDTYLKEHFGINYDVDTLDKKKEIKLKYLSENGIKKPDLNKPLIGIVSRLVDQKGWDIILEIIDQLFKEDIYFTVLGTGKYEYENRLRSVKSNYPDKMIVEIGFDIPNSHYIEAASDIYLMPSRFEPCGLNQLYSLAYGTVPVVRYTGGLADTVKDGKTGFVFKNYNPEDMMAALKKAIDMYRTSQDKWKKLMENAMKEDWSWKKAIKSYNELYDKVMAK